MWRYLNRAYIRYIDLQTLNAHTFIFRYLFSIINGFFISSIYNTLHMYVVVIEFYLKLTVNQFILLFMLWRGKFFCHSTRALYDCFKWLGLVVVVLNFLEHSILHGTRKETVHWPMFILFFHVTDWMLLWNRYYTVNYEWWFWFDDYLPTDVHVIMQCSSCTICWIYWVN